MYEDGVLHVRPVAPKQALSPGVHRIPLRSGASGLLAVPRRGVGRRPFLLMLHGAGARAEQALALVRDCAEEAGLLVLAPQARGRSWDFVEADYGPDVETIDDLLAVVFARVEVDPTRLAVGGFSDGASYALSLAMRNRGLFTHVVAFSPGFAVPAECRGGPQIFISHGRHDRVLPVGRCSGRIAPELARAGFPVDYREFDGGHEVPHTIVGDATRWLVEGTTAHEPVLGQPAH